MRQQACISTLTICGLLLTAVVPAWAQLSPTSDWSLVENLRPGTAISVKAGVRTACAFRDANEQELICDRYDLPLPAPPTPVWLSGGYPQTVPREVVIRRDAVHEVRLEHRAGSIAAGVFLGTTAGAVAGANTGSGATTRVGREIGLGIVGAIVGGFTARAFNFHGKVIYRR